MYNNKEIVKHALQNYLDHLEQKRLSPATLSRYKSVLTKFVKHIDYDFSNLTVQLLGSFNKNRYYKTVIANFLDHMGIKAKKKESEINPFLKTFVAADPNKLKISKSTHNMYISLLKQLFMRIEDNNITEEIIKGWLKNNVAQTKIVKISALEKYLVFNNIKLDFNLDDFRPKKSELNNNIRKNCKDAPMTDQEIKKLTSWLNSIKWNSDTEDLKDKCIILLGFEAGIRIMSVKNIMIKHFDFENDVLEVTEKGTKIRHITIKTRFKRFIKKYIEVMELKENDYLINNKNKNYTEAGISKRIDSRFKEIGIKNNRRNLSFHNLRHTYASLAYNAGIPLELIQDELGHEKLETTKIYATASDKTKKKLLSKSFIKY